MGFEGVSGVSPRFAASPSKSTRTRRATRIAAPFALASALFGVVGGVFVTIGVSALSDPWVGGYVSEGGVLGAGHSTIYRVGIALLAVSTALLAAALSPVSRSRMRPPPPRWLPRWLPSASTLLVASAAMGSVSSRVSCTPGCPLPPFQRTTPQDLVHAGSSVSAVGFVALAMAVIAAGYPAGPLRLVARVGSAFCLPALFAMAVAIPVAGRDVFTSVLERLSLVAVLAWIVVTGLTVAAPLASRRASQAVEPRMPPGRP